MRTMPSVFFLLAWASTPPPPRPAFARSIVAFTPCTTHTTNVTALITRSIKPYVSSTTPNHRIRRKAALSSRNPTPTEASPNTTHTPAATSVYSGTATSAPHARAPGLRLIRRACHNNTAHCSNDPATIASPIPPVISANLNGPLLPVFAVSTNSFPVTYHKNPPPKTTGTNPTHADTFSAVTARHVHRISHAEESSSSSMPAHHILPPLPTLSPPPTPLCVLCLSRSQALNILA
jgi:hypothetical protein